MNTELQSKIMDFITVDHARIDEAFVTNYFGMMPDGKNQLIDKKIKLYNAMIKSKSDTIELKDVSTISDSKRIISVTIVDNDEKIKLFNDFISVFYFDSFLVNQYHELLKLKKNHTVLNIDLEFNSNKAALMQLHFETFNSNWIFIIDPNILNSDFINNILCNNFVIKIMHGSESLDLPYMFTTLLDNRKEDIHKFTNTLFDTRFVCEYVKSANAYYEKKKTDQKCSLYTALLDFDIIDNRQFKMLNHISNNMGPVHRIIWNVNKLNKMQTRYAYFDVVYLRQLYKHIIKKANIEIHEGITFIPYMFRLTCLERAQVTDVINVAKEETDKMNNYLVDKVSADNDKNVTLISLFDKLMKKMILPSGLDINTLLLVTFLKKTCITLFKKSIYVTVSKNYTLYKDRKTTFTDIIDMTDTYAKLKTLKFDKLVSMLEDIISLTSKILKDNVNI